MNTRTAEDVEAVRTDMSKQAIHGSGYMKHLESIRTLRVVWTMKLVGLLEMLVTK